MQSPAFKPVDVLASMKRLLREYGKPIIFVAPGGEYTVSNLKKIESEARIPTFKSPEEAAKAYYFLASWYKSYRTLKTLSEGSSG
jgi:acyl-CoA synthetase (NDP forming)